MTNHKNIDNSILLDEDNHVLCLDYIADIQQKPRLHVARRRLTRLEPGLIVTRILSNILMWVEPRLRA